MKAKRDLLNVKRAEEVQEGILADVSFMRSMMIRMNENVIQKPHYAIYLWK